MIVGGMMVGPVSAAEGFSDIADAGAHRANVETLAEWGILEGTECAPGRFCPKEPIQRWEMAVWLVRAVDFEPDAVEGSRFADVGVWWLPHVERLADLGITRGCSVKPALFCPYEPVTRQQMASFLVRAFQLEQEQSNTFADVDAGNPHFADINGLATAGITAGCGTDRFCPTLNTTRAQMATFLARALGIATTEETFSCRPQGTTGITVGFPLPNWAVPAIGAPRVAVLFVDFPDAQASYSTHQEADAGLPYTKRYLEAVSYGKFEPRFVSFHRWLRAEHDYALYLEESVAGDFRLGQGVVTEAVRLADPEFDFTNIDAVMVVMPSTHFSSGNAGGWVETDEGTIGNTTRINSFPRDKPGELHQWGYIGAHELVHNLGLADLYPYDADRHNPPYPPTGVWVETVFGLMGLEAFTHTSEDDPRIDGEPPDGFFIHYLRADEMLAWSRWQLGWLEPDQIHCVTTETTITISPAASLGREGAMIAIPVSETEVIVIESRRELGYDTGWEHQWDDGTTTTFPNLLDEGVLVYTVNASIESGQLPIIIVGDPGHGHLEYSAILTEGESVTIWGYTITVQTSTLYTDTIIIAGPQ